MSAEQPPTKPVVFAPSARKDLEAIWSWNEKFYGQDHASQYVDSLHRRIDKLETGYDLGLPVPTRPGLLFVPLRHQGRGHFHLAVYRSDPKSVNILHIFHSAQDWQNMLP